MQPALKCDCLHMHACRCNDNLLPYMGTSTIAQQAAVVWIPRVVGLVSLVSSALILYHILRGKCKRKVYQHQMMILIAVLDIVTSLVCGLWGQPRPSKNITTIRKSNRISMGLRAMKRHAPPVGYSFNLVRERVCCCFFYI